jgi:rhodanese-related sulfurtransferase
VTNVAGYLAGGMTSWREDQRPVQRTARMSLTELHERWAGDDPPQVLDVREADEWAQGHIPGSVHRPYHDIDAIPPGIDPDRTVAVVCATGQRAAVAASLVRRHGGRDVVHVVDGGVPRWGREGWPLQPGA